MGKTTDCSIATKQEFARLEILLSETANAIIQCLKVLKGNLGRYDKRHGLYLGNTSKYCMRSDIRVAKNLAIDLRHVAKRISKSESCTQSEINAARISMNAAADAMNDLKQSGRIFDQNQIKRVLGDATPCSIIESILSGNERNQDENGRGDCANEDNKPKGHKCKHGRFGPKHIGEGTPDTVEAVVKWTLHENFGGFATLKQQLRATEKALSSS
ncbi:hypothetical protein PsorP6_002808 [Peronosclerospora sorghi]|uniref:Uncharacterized protein n=1 Tax=Peronosclerospora sorghi TaxID=230839 RepID=A0ACC0VP67_9STRA|nr:hypothetical protein PsorP6_002808 [Peronosclerospora sorghi]